MSQEFIKLENAFADISTMPLGPVDAEHASINDDECFRDISVYVEDERSPIGQSVFIAAAKDPKNEGQFGQIMYQHDGLSSHIDGTLNVNETYTASEDGMHYSILAECSFSMSDSSAEWMAETAAEKLKTALSSSNSNDRDAELNHGPIMTELGLDVVQEEELRRIAKDLNLAAKKEWPTLAASQESVFEIPMRQATAERIATVTHYILSKTAHTGLVQSVPHGFDELQIQNVSKGIIGYSLESYSPSNLSTNRATYGVDMSTQPPRLAAERAISYTDAEDGHTETDVMVPSHLASEMEALELFNSLLVAASHVKAK